MLTTTEKLEKHQGNNVNANVHKKITEISVTYIKFFIFLIIYKYNYYVILYLKRYILYAFL